MTKQMLSVCGAHLALAMACGGNLDVGSKDHASGGLATPGQGGQGSASQGGQAQNSQGGQFGGSTSARCDSSGGRELPQGAGGWAVAPPNWEAPAQAAVSPPIAQECDLPFYQIWEGFREDQFFAPVDRWRITLTGRTENGRVCGAVTFIGDGEEPPAPALDGAANYPVGSSSPTDQFPWPGFSYSIIEGGQQAGQLRLSILPTELYADWCALQTPRLGYSGYNCLGSGTFNVQGACCELVDWTTARFHYMSAAQCTLCPAVCSCDATRCTAADTHGPGTSPGSRIELQLQQVGAELSGTIAENPILLKQVE